MKPEYQTWIKDNVPVDCLNTCHSITEAMQKAFPYLGRVRGHVFLSTGLERPHFWLVDTDGTIVDPTERQFSSDYYGHKTKVLSYDPWDESQPEPTGMCPNCGGVCYDYKDLCSERCEISYTAYLNGGGL